MKNFIQNGDTITLTAPSDVRSGGGVLVGAIFGVSCNDALAGTEVEAKLTGVFSLPKVVTESWSAGDLIYWNDILKQATSVSGKNPLVGVAVAASANPSSTGLVRLNGTAVTTDTTALVNDNPPRNFNSTAIDE